VIAGAARRLPRGRAFVRPPEKLIDLQVWQSDRDAGEVVMVSRWSDRAAFTAYMKSADHKTSHCRIDPGLKADITLRKLEHMHAYEVVAE
jgi:heme oxygenase (mycobilin-producing)